MAGNISVAGGVSEVIPSAAQMGAVTDPASATQGGTGITSIGVNQVPMGTAAGAYVGTNIGSRLIGYASSLALTASGDIALTMSNAANLGSYIVRRVMWGAPVSSALATCILVATVRTASGGGGSAITGALVVTGLSATTAFLDQAVTLASGITTSTQLYVNVTTAAGTAPASGIYVYGDTLGV